MKAIEIIRRDLRESAWLEHSSESFAGMLHDFSKPLRSRLEQRQYTSPYYHRPTKPGQARGFYQHSKRLACGDSSFNLRLEEANNHLASYSRLSRITGYFCDRFQDETLKPIVARLPHGRGFLAGWTMGRGMCATLDLYVHDTAESAAQAAHDMAEYDAEQERERDASGPDLD